MTPTALPFARVALALAACALAALYTRDEPGLRWGALAIVVVASIPWPWHRLGRSRALSGWALWDNAALRVALSAMVLVLALNQHYRYPIPFTVAASILLRDVAAATFMLIRLAKGKPLHTRPLGATTTAVTALAIASVLSEAPFTLLALALAGIMNCVALVDYALFGWRVNGDDMPD